MKYRVGQVCEIVYIRHTFWHDPTGEECVITAIGPWKAGNAVEDDPFLMMDADYRIKTSTGCVGYVLEDQLRPKRRALGSWEDIQEAVGWSPVKTKENA